MNVNTFYDEEKNEWSGYQIPLMYHPNVSIGQLVLNSWKNNPNRVVQVNDNNGIEMTTDQLKIRTIRMALHLAKFNMTNDDCIGIVAKTNHNTTPVVVAALLIGVPFYPLDPSFDSADIQHMYNLTKPKIIFCDYDIFDHVKNATAKIGLNPTFVTFDQQIEGTQFIEEYFEPIVGDDNFIPIQIENGEKSVAIIVCSSGTSGLSKAVCLSHAQVTHQFTSGLKLTCNDVCLNFSSLHWITCLISMLAGSILCCKRIVTTEKFTPELLIKIVQKYKVTQVCGPPIYLGLTLKHPKVADYDLSSLQHFMCGGTVCPDEYIIKAKQLLPNCNVATLYGLSEMGGVATYNSSDDPKSVGYIVPSLKMRIVDDNGKYLGANEKGEIIMQSKYSFLGYKGDAKISSSTASNINGWLYTGDIGYFDEHCRLYFVDRKSDILKYQNSSVSSTELEAFLLHNRFINAVTVVGIPDLANGDLPAALIVKTPGCKESDDEIKHIVYELVKTNLSDFQILRGGVYIVNDLPLTLTGKVLKCKAKEIAVDLYNNKINNI